VRSGKRVYLKRKVKNYFEKCIFDVYVQIGKANITYEKVKVLRDLYPPDKRRRDEDNIVKALNDVLMKTKIIADDSQIKKAMNVMHNPQKPGHVKITLEEI
jgi:Holliday junction resolvase RusA-like endonuclease